MAPDYQTVYIELLSIAARGRGDSISSTYDAFVPNKIHGLQQLIELQQRVKAGSLTVDGALERFSDWQQVQKGMDAVQQVKEHAGPNPNKNRPICCACHANLQNNPPTIEHEGTRNCQP